MKSNRIYIEKIVSIFSFIYVFTIFCICMYLVITNQVPSVLVPSGKIILPLIHGLCSLGTLFLIFKTCYPLFFIIFQTESIVCMFTGFDTLGIFFYFVSVFLLFILYYTSSFIKHAITTCYIIHLTCIIISIVKNWQSGIVNLFTSIFMLFIFIWIFKILKVKYSCFLPSAVNNTSKLGDIKLGSQISLSSFDLSERQISFIEELINNNATYKILSEKYYVSVSTVKKEFSAIFRIFGVSKLEELRLLLLQYQITK